jgi:signal transduction histidine kinase
MIRRVLVNLVDNAIKYTQSAGNVQLDVQLTEPKIIFKIIDNGPGISPEYQKRIFDKFARVDHTSKIQGVGLGLAFCKLAIEAHQGRIWIESELNVGSTFIFEIPRDLLERARSK